MNIFSSTLSQTIYLFLLILIGFFLVKAKILPKGSAAVLAKLENWIFIPALMFKTFADDFTVDRLGRSGSSFLFSTAILVLTVPIGLLTARLLTKDHFDRNVFTYGLIFSNFGYMGIAVVEAVFPQYIGDYLVFVMPLYLLIYLWAVPMLLMGEEQRSFRQSLRSLCNPMFVGVLLGVLVGLGGSLLPDVTLPPLAAAPIEAVDTVITALKSCMSPVAMLLTGITVANIDLKKTFSNLQIYQLTLIRLLILPAVFLILFRMIPSLPEVLLVCGVASLAMPLGLNTVVIPSAYGKDVSVAAGMALVSHLLSCLTIPLIFSFL